MLHENELKGRIELRVESLKWPQHLVRAVHQGIAEVLDLKSMRLVYLGDVIRQPLDIVMLFNLLVALKTHHSLLHLFEDLLSVLDFTEERNQRVSQVEEASHFVQ